jgi:hypothetical protein
MALAAYETREAYQQKLLLPTHLAQCLGVVLTHGVLEALTATIAFDLFRHLIGADWTWIGLRPLRLLCRSVRPAFEGKPLEINEYVGHLLAIRCPLQYGIWSEFPVCGQACRLHLHILRRSRMRRKRRVASVIRNGVSPT